MRATKIKIIKFDISTRTRGKELWKYNQKGFYNFIQYVNEDEIKHLVKTKYKGYQIIDKTGSGYEKLYNN